MTVAVIAAGLTLATVPLASAEISTPEISPSSATARDSAPATSATSGSDTYLQPSGNQGYDVRSYRLRLRYGDRRHDIQSARVAIAARAISPLQSFSLDAKRGLKIDRVTVNGQKARYRKSRGKVIIWDFGVVKANSRLNTTVSYHGRPKPTKDSSGRGRYGWLRTPGGVVTYNEPVGTSTWVPSNDVFYDKARWKVDVRVPKGLIGVSTGRLTKRSTKGNSTRTVWKMKTPIQPYAQVLAIDNFKIKKGRIAGIPSFVAVAKGSGVSVSKMKQRTRRSINWLTERLGTYPYKDTGAIVVSGGDSAMETAGRPTYSADPYYTSMATVLHEQAHQWFGNRVTATHARDMWIHEGFATYLENVEAAERTGRSLDDLVHGQYVTDGWGAKFHHQFQTVSLADPTPTYLLNTTVYFRGQAAVHALRHTLGEGMFWRTLKGLANTADGRTTDTAEVLGKIQEISGQNVTAWANTWLYSKGFQQLPVAPSHTQVISELGAPLLDAAADWSWRKNGTLDAALQRAIKSYAPTSELVIHSIRTAGSGRDALIYVDFGTVDSPLYPQAYRSCLVFKPKSSVTAIGAYGGLRMSRTFAPNTFTTQACPA